MLGAKLLLTGIELTGTKKDLGNKLVGWKRKLLFQKILNG
jgi:hypothetical protein